MKPIPKLTAKQGQRFFEAFLEDVTEPEYAEAMSWGETEALLAEIFGIERYEVDDFVCEHFRSRFWPERPKHTPQPQERPLGFRFGGGSVFGERPK